MRIKLISAITGTTAHDNEEQLAYLKRYVHDETVIDYAGIESGFPSIESETQGIFNAVEIIKEALKAEHQGYDGVFVNCFDDPGVFAARELIKIPVYGGYMPSVSIAASLGERVGIITTDEDGILNEERKARQMPNNRIVAIEPVNLGVLELRNEQTLLTRLVKICIEFRERHRIQAVILGCTGMYYAIDRLRRELKTRGCNLAVIEPLASGLKYLETVIQLGHTNSLHYNINTQNLVYKNGG